MNQHGVAEKDEYGLVRSPIIYNIGAPPPRLAHKHKGVLVISDKKISVTGPMPVELSPTDVSELSFRRGYFEFYISLTADICVFLRPYTFDVMGFLQGCPDSRVNEVYTALHRLIGGPGSCVKCRYDLRASTLPCSECGGMVVSPID